MRVVLFIWILASRYVLKIRITSLTNIGLSYEIIYSGITTIVLMAASWSHSRMHSPLQCNLAPHSEEQNLFSIPGDMGWPCDLLWLVVYGAVMLYKFWNLGLKKLCSFHLCPLGMSCHEEAWGERSWRGKGPVVSAIRAEPSPQHTHWLNVALWMNRGKSSRRTNHTVNRIMNNNKPLLFEATRLWGGLLHSNG